MKKITRDSLCEMIKGYVRRYDKSPNEVRINDEHAKQIIELCRKECGEVVSRKISDAKACMGMTWVVDSKAKRMSPRYNPKRR